MKYPTWEELTDLIEFVRDHQGLVELSDKYEYGAKIGGARAIATAERLPALIDALKQAERGQTEAHRAMSKARHAQGVAEVTLSIS